MHFGTSHVSERAEVKALLRGAFLQGYGICIHCWGFKITSKRAAPILSGLLLQSRQTANWQQRRNVLCCNSITSKQSWRLQDSFHPLSLFFFLLSARVKHYSVTNLLKNSSKSFHMLPWDYKDWPFFLGHTKILPTHFSPETVLEEGQEEQKIPSAATFL